VWIPAHLKRNESLRIAPQSPRQHRIVVAGAYQKRNGDCVFSVADQLLTEGELLSILRDEKLPENEIKDLISEIGKQSEVVRRQITSHRDSATFPGPSQFTSSCAQIPGVEVSTVWVRILDRWGRSE
jgi:hypothetical protein